MKLNLQLLLEQKRKWQSSHVIIKANGVHTAICCITIIYTNCDKRKRSRQGQSNGNFSRLALRTINFGHCQAQGKIQTLHLETMKYIICCWSCATESNLKSVPYYSF